MLTAAKQSLLSSWQHTNENDLIKVKIGNGFFLELQFLTDAKVSYLWRIGKLFGNKNWKADLFAVVIAASYAHYSVGLLTITSAFKHDVTLIPRRL
jgi:hypothetical protein